MWTTNAKYVGRTHRPFLSLEWLELGLRLLFSTTKHVSRQKAGGKSNVGKQDIIKWYGHTQRRAADAIEFGNSLSQPSWKNLWLNWARGGGR